MGRRRHRVRSDASSTQVQVNAVPTVAPAWKWSSTLDVRDYTHVALFFNMGLNVSASRFNLVASWSDDGTTIPFTDDDNFQQSDVNIANFTDGTFNPQAYTARLTLFDGSLALNQQMHFVFPVKGGFVRFGVNANSSNSNYTLRAQRLVR